MSEAASPTSPGSQGFKEAVQAKIKCITSPDSEPIEELHTLVPGGSPVAINIPGTGTIKLSANFLSDGEDGGESGGGACECQDRADKEAAVVSNTLKQIVPLRKMLSRIRKKVECLSTNINGGQTPRVDCGSWYGSPSEKPPTQLPMASGPPVGGQSCGRTKELPAIIEDPPTHIQTGQSAPNAYQQAPYDQPHSTHHQSSYAHPHSDHHREMYDRPQSPCQYGHPHSDHHKGGYDHPHTAHHENPYGHSHSEHHGGNFGHSHSEHHGGGYGHPQPAHHESPYGHPHSVHHESPYGHPHSVHHESPYGHPHSEHHGGNFGQPHSERHGGGYDHPHTAHHQNPYCPPTSGYRSAYQQESPSEGPPAPPVPPALPERLCHGPSPIQEGVITVPYSPNGPYMAAPKDALYCKPPPQINKPNCPPYFPQVPPVVPVDMNSCAKMPCAPCPVRAAEEASRRKYDNRYTMKYGTGVDVNVRNDAPPCCVPQLIGRCEPCATTGPRNEPCSSCEYRKEPTC